MSTTRHAGLTGHDPATYAASPLHAAERAFRETHCYTDVVIELLHALGHDPRAVLGHLVRMDFEGDQWTFFKPPAEDLERLFGVDIHEMQPYRALPGQIAEQIARGRTIIVELDSYHLPDTAATSYRTEHVKTSVAVDWIDLEGERMHYFHGVGLHALHGADYRAVFRLDDADDATLPPYTELVRLDAGPRPAEDALRTAAAAILAHHLERRPARNPFTAFGDQLSHELPRLLAEDLEFFHAYAFATVRMAGAAFELLGDHARWLFGDDAAREAGDAATELVDGCKAMLFRLARRRRFDPTDRIAALAAAWERLIAGLRAGVSGPR
jgi:hypothetical protein